MRSAGLPSSPVAGTLCFELMALVAGQAPDAFPLDRQPPPTLAASTASRFEVAWLTQQRLNVSSLGEVRDIQAFHPLLRPPFHAGAAPPAAGGPARDAPGPPRDDAAAAPYFDPDTLADLVDTQQGLPRQSPAPSPG